MKPIVYFSHGNGFPARCYQQMLNQLEQTFTIKYIDAYGHHPHYPVTDSWTLLAQELIDKIKQAESQPVCALGHSFGGVISCLAAAKQPELFSHIILLDSPIYGTVKSTLIKWIKRWGLIDRVTPAGRTRTRKRIWANAEQAFDYLRQKKVFADFDEQCLMDYIQYGTRRTEQGLELMFDVNIEYQIYNTIPHNLKQVVNSLDIPVGLVYGSKSDIIRGFDLRNMKKHIANLHIKRVMGGHLFPFEVPHATALAVRELWHLFKS